MEFLKTVVAAFCLWVIIAISVYFVNWWVSLILVIGLFSLLILNEYLGWRNERAGPDREVVINIRCVLRGGYIDSEENDRDSNSGAKIREIARGVLLSRYGWRLRRILKSMLECGAIKKIDGKYYNCSYKSFDDYYKDRFIRPFSIRG